MNEWFDLANIEELHFNEDKVMPLDIDSLYEWLLKDRQYKTCSLLTCLDSSLFMELSRCPLTTLKDIYLSKNVTYVLDPGIYKIEGTTSDNPLEQLWVIYRVMNYLGEELNLDNVVAVFDKHFIPLKREYIERLKPHVEEFNKLLKIYPQMVK